MYCFHYSALIISPTFSFLYSLCVQIVYIDRSIVIKCLALAKTNPACLMSCYSFLFGLCSFSVLSHSVLLTHYLVSPEGGLRGIRLKFYNMGGFLEQVVVVAIGMYKFHKMILCKSWIQTSRFFKVLAPSLKAS